MALPTSAEPQLLPDGLKSSYLALVERRFGLVPSDHEIRELQRAVASVVEQSPFADASVLYAALAAGEHPELLDLLGAHLCIGETHFFRVLPQISALQDVVLPDLITRKSGARELRIWSAGCSTGEEAYTLAILLHELDLDRWSVDLIGSDVSRPSLEAARRALYGEWSFRDTPSRVRGSYFARDENRWRIDASISGMVKFCHLNLVDPLPLGWLQPSGFDLILCRNVTLYFSEETTRRVYAELERALEPGGWLVLGPSDPGPDRSIGLEPVFLPEAVMWRRPLPQAESWSQGPEKKPRKLASPGAAGRGAPWAPIGAASARHSGAGTRPLAHIRPLPPRGNGAKPAEKLSASARSLDPADYLVAGLKDLEAGDFSRAVENLRRSIFLDDENPLAHFGLGLAFSRLGELARARAASLQARRLLALLPDASEISNSSGLMAGDLRHAVDAQIDALGAAAGARSGGTR